MGAGRRRHRAAGMRSLCARSLPTANRNRARSAFLYPVKPLLDSLALRDEDDFEGICSFSHLQTFQGLNEAGADLRMPAISCDVEEWTGEVRAPILH